jgi:hypothetical protein
LKGDSVSIKVDVIYELPKKRGDVSGGFYISSLSKKYFLPLSENFKPVITLPILDKPFSPGATVPISLNDIKVEDKNDDNIIKWIAQSKDYQVTGQGIIINKDFTGNELSVSVFATDLKDTTFAVLKVEMKTVGIEDLVKTPSLSIYPNPLVDTNRFSVRNLAKFDTAMLLNSIGQEISLEYSTGSNNFTIKEHIQPGFYILKLNSDNKVYSVKMIKR